MIHKKILERLDEARKEKKLISIYPLGDGGCAIHEDGCNDFKRDEAVTIMEINPEGDYFITSDGERYSFTSSSKIHYI